VYLGIYDESGNPQLKEVVISNCAGNFTPVNNNLACQSVGITGTLNITWGGRQDQCNLVGGGIYYLNVRSLDQNRVTVQFGARALQAISVPGGGRGR
jgi:hypothetical protein